MIRNMMIASGVAFAILAAGCASTASEKPVAEAPKPAPAAPAAPSAPAAPALPAAVAAAQAPGEAIFNKNCMGCHGSGRAPAVTVLAAKTSAEVVEALTTGKMARMGAALSAEEKANVAMFLTKKPVA